jgi:hypothetical protein
MNRFALAAVFLCFQLALAAALSGRSPVPAGGAGAPRFEAPVASPGSAAARGATVARPQRSAGPAAPEGRAAASRTGRTRPALAVSHPAAPLPVERQRALADEYCAGCHNDVDLKGNMSLDAFDFAHPERQAALAEKIVRKLRAGMMPPAGRDRPEGTALLDLAASLEARLDQAAAARPDPGYRPFQRLTRAEYARAVRELIGIDVDVAAFLPPDTVSDGFDNVADVQMFSPTLMEGYLRAAARIAALALGDPRATPTAATYKVPRTASQMQHVEGAPLGTRGGLVVDHVFPADGEYVFKIMLHSIPTGPLFGLTHPGEQIEVSIDGERVALLDIDPRMSESDPNGMTIQTPPVVVRAGPHRVAAAFLQRFEGPVDDLLAPIDHTLADTQIGSAPGMTALPHVRDFTISGPHRVFGVSDTPSRRRVFTCRPTQAAEEAGCAREILARLASQAYRRPADREDVDGLMRFYEAGRREADFETGIRRALQAMLASPHFVFKLEEAPATVAAGQAYRLSDRALATRLAFFLWAAPPDAALLEAAARGALGTPAGLDRQVRRMLADPRAEALATRFAAQWLRLQDLDKIHPDALLYPYYDRTLADGLRRETELFFYSLVREDRSLLDLITADYTFVNERVARHYGIPGVVGPEFRRVTLADENRRGILGHGSILTLTSVADRTSPVLRGKWVMEVLLGSPPPPPPPNVPDLEQTGAAKGARLLSVRERLAEHRRNPSCNSCHRVIDPLGLALEPFDVTGRWRIRDNGVPVDAAGVLYDGTPLDGPAALRAALLKYKDVVVTNFTERLMTYAVGRRVEPADMPAVRSIVREAARQDYRLSAFILGVVRSPAFRMSRAEPAEQTETVASRALAPGRAERPRP